MEEEEQRKDHKVANIVWRSNGHGKWDKIMKSLGVEEYKITSIREDNSMMVEDKWNKAFIQWWSSNPSLDVNAKIEKLIVALKEEDLVEAAHNVKQYLEDLSSEKSQMANSSEKDLSSEKSQMSNPSEKDLSSEKSQMSNPSEKDLSSEKSQMSNPSEKDLSSEKSQMSNPSEKDLSSEKSQMANSSEKVAHKAQTTLKERYQENKYQLLSLLEENCRGKGNLKDNFTHLTYIRENCSGDTVGSGDQTTESLDELLNQTDFPIRVAIQGDPGMGKTTLCHKLCSDWAQSEIEDPLRKFKLVCLIHLRRIKIQSAEHIVDLMLDTKLLPREEWNENDIELLKTYIDYNPELICIIFDGLDEIRDTLKENIKDYWGRDKCRKTPIIVTGRPEEYNILKAKATNTYHLILKGFDRDMQKKFIKSYFSNKDDQINATHHFLKTRQMSHLTSNPLMLSLLCKIYKDQSGETQQPQTQLTDFAILLLIKREAEKEKRTTTQSSLDTTQTPLNDCKTTKDLPDEYIKDLSKFAYEKCMADEYQFSDKPKCKHHGTILEIQSSLSSKKEYTFKHRSFQEFLATLYIHKKHIKLEDKIEFLKQRPNLCRYICGFQGQSCFFLIAKLLEAASNLDFGNDDLWLSCLFEAIECIRQCHDEKGFDGYRESVHTSFYKEISDTISKESLTCSSTFIMTLVNLIAYCPTHPIWSKVTRISLNCKQRWSDDEIGKYHKILEDNRSNSDLLALLANATHGDVPTFRFKATFERIQKSNMKVEIPSIGRDKCLTLCHKLCDSLNCSGLTLDIKDFFLDKEEPCLKPHDYKFAEFDLSITNIKEDQAQAIQNSESEEEDVSESKEELDKDDKPGALGGNELALLEQGPQKESEQKNAFFGFFKKMKFTKKKTKKKQTQSVPGKDQMLPPSDDGYQQQDGKQEMLSNDSNQQLTYEQEMNMLSIYCPQNIDGTTCHIERISKTAPLSKLRHLVLNGIQSTEIDMINDKLDKLDSLLLTYDKHNEFSSDILKKLNIQTKVFCIVTEHQESKEHFAEIQSLSHVTTSVLTSEVADTVFEYYNQNLIGTSFIQDNCMKLQDRFKGRNVEKCIVGLSSWREVWISGGYRQRPGGLTDGIERLGVAGGEVSRLPSSLTLPWQVSCHCASLHAGAGRLVVAGGEALQGGEFRFDLACMLDVLTGQSSHLPHLTTERVQPCGFVLGDRMYVAAGEEGPGDKQFNTVESICVSQPESAWQPAPSLPPRTGGRGMAACVSNKSVFLSGGEVSRSCMITWQQGWPQWQKRADMNTPRRFHAMACDGHDKVWVLGGLPGEASMEEYDIQTDQWTILPSLPHPRCWTGAVFCAGRIILPGGEGRDDEDDDEDQGRSSVFMYDVREKIWSRSPLQLQHPVYFCAVTLV